jgi:hypothetical protein
MKSQANRMRNLLKVARNEYEIHNEIPGSKSEIIGYESNPRHYENEKLPGLYEIFHKKPQHFTHCAAGNCLDFIITSGSHYCLGSTDNLMDGFSFLSSLS